DGLLTIRESKRIQEMHELGFLFLGTWLVHAHQGRESGSTYPEVWGQIATIRNKRKTYSFTFVPKCIFHS
ncbi:hypothetical protein, partial [Corynebacterium amycolatum]|uniref:hypothetical protein n=1 Tax=Corynebacterium amycolatum TaxID=43765 RepID=UPI0039761313